MTVISYLATIRFESGAIRHLPAALAEVRIRRPLVVTDRGIVDTGLLARVLEASASPDAAVFDRTPPNPTEDAVLDAASLFRNAGCDGVLGVGGGSSLDLAKGVALAVSHSEPLATYAAVAGGIGLITPETAPVLAVPTTAGTGSEVGRAALLTLRDGRKLGFISPHLIPKQAICDPDLTLGLPPYLTAATGMDALTHCFETYLSPRINPPAEAIALDGLARAWTFLPRAVANGADTEARWEMMMAALEGGLTFQKGLGAVHGMSHALGGSRDPILHHGTLNAVLLPAVLRFNEPAAEEKYARLRATLGLSANADLAEAVQTFAGGLGLPATLREMGVTQAMLRDAAEGAVIDHSTATNPRPVDRAQYETLLQEAF